MINVIALLKESTFLLLQQNLGYDDDGNRLATNLTDEQAKAIKHTLYGYWKDVMVDGEKFIVVSGYLPERTIGERGELAKLYWAEFLQGAFPGMFIIIAAWSDTGKMYGRVKHPATYDYEGNELTAAYVTGSPVYPLSADYMAIFPDDADGNPAALPSEVHTLDGWPEREWS